MSGEFDCQTCGLCCLELGGKLGLYEEDFARWRAEDARDILVRIGKRQESPACTFVSAAPYRCTIYDTRPLVCRHFANGGSACRELRAKHGLSQLTE